MIRTNTLINRTKLWFFLSTCLLIFLLLAIIISQIVISVDKHYRKSALNDIIFEPIGGNYQDENTLSFTIQSGDTLSSILSNSGVTETDVTNVITSLRKTYNPGKVSIGQNISLFFEDAKNENNNPIKQLSAMKISISPEKTIEINRIDSSTFSTKEINVPLVKYLVHVNSEIKNSLFATTSNLGIPYAIISEMVKAFSYDIDFQRDIQEGDKLSIVYERYYDGNGNYARDGKPVFMSINTGGEELKLYYFETERSGEYYNEKGESVKKELLKTPINASRISSGYGLRTHPILGYSMMHKGVDFSAPFGTPIYAAGDGVVEEMGRKGTYGNYIRIRHSNGFSTAYAHISRFTKGLRSGTRVKQGQTIAAVGSTGRASGPHLHFEVLQHNKQINPLKVKFASNVKLHGNDIKKFKYFVSRISNKVLTTANNSEIAAEFVVK